MQFQMTAPTKSLSLGDMANEGYNEQSGGGESTNFVNGVTLLSDLVTIADPAAKDFFAPDSQYVVGAFNVEYQNIPFANATTTITMTDLFINNSSNALVHYNVYITNSNGDKYSSPAFSAAPGATVNVPLPDIPIDQSIDISVYAISGFCSEPCYNVEHPTILTGVGTTQVNPY